MVYLNNLKNNCSQNISGLSSNTQLVHPQDLLPCIAYFHWYRSCFVYSGLVCEIYSGGGPSTYVYCVVCYRVIVAPYVRRVALVFAYLYILDDDSERPMDYETSLLPKVFHSIPSYWIWSQTENETILWCMRKPA